MIRHPHASALKGAEHSLVQRDQSLIPPQTTIILAVQTRVSATVSRRSYRLWSVRSGSNFGIHEPAVKGREAVVYAARVQSQVGNIVGVPCLSALKVG